MADMAGQVALVTGGMRGIGRAIAERLTARGVTVTAGCSGSNADHAYVIAEVLNAHGRLDILVNDAGFTVDRTRRRMNPEEWNRVVHVNVSAALSMSRTVLQHMLDQGYGRIITISSVIGSCGDNGDPDNSGARSGVFGLTMQLALETAKKGITCNSVVPGYIITDTTAPVAEAATERIIATTSPGRLGDPEKVARVVELLADPDSGHITGQLYAVNGVLHL